MGDRVGELVRRKFGSGVAIAVALGAWGLTVAVCTGPLRELCGPPGWARALIVAAMWGAMAVGMALPCALLSGERLRDSTFSSLGAAALTTVLQLGLEASGQLASPSVLVALLLVAGVLQAVPSRRFAPTLAMLLLQLAGGAMDFTLMLALGLWMVALEPLRRRFLARIGAPVVTG